MMKVIVGYRLKSDAEMDVSFYPMCQGCRSSKAYIISRNYHKVAKTAVSGWNSFIKHDGTA
jgi:hypothetical protein